MLQETIDQEDKYLQQLRKEWGYEVYLAVVIALTEIKEYNMKDRTMTHQLWNFEEGRKATSKRSHLFNWGKTEGGKDQRYRYAFSILLLFCCNCCILLQLVGSSQPCFDVFKSYKHLAITLRYSVRPIKHIMMALSDHLLASDQIRSRGTPKQISYKVCSRNKRKLLSFVLYMGKLDCPKESYYSIFSFCS